MFYEIELMDHIRVPPKEFGEDTKASVLRSLNQHFDNYMSKELGFVIGVHSISNIGEGIIIPGDGAAYYETTFKVFAFKPELQEVIVGKISEITDFGAFMDIGPIDGMIHISQTMDDYVSFSKDNALQGKESKRILKVGDDCRARIIAISYKDPANPKIGLTMRQPWLGALHHIDEDLKKAKDSAKKAVKTVEKKK